MFGPIKRHCWHPTNSMLYRILIYKKRHNGFLRNKLHFFQTIFSLNFYWTNLIFGGFFSIFIQIYREIWEINDWALHIQFLHTFLYILPKCNEINEIIKLLCWIRWKQWIEWLHDIFVYCKSESDGNHLKRAKNRPAPPKIKIKFSCKSIQASTMCNKTAG